MRRGYATLAASLLLLAAGCGGEDAGTVTTDSGLKYIDQKEGVGDAAKAGDLVEVHYTGWLRSNGTEFDSSVGKQPFRFALGAGMVIKGWDEGVAGMKTGGKRKLIIPYNLAYGEQGRPPKIPERSDLVFEVELLRIVADPMRAGRADKVQIEDLKEGSGTPVKDGTRVEVFYTGRLKSNGKQFDSNVGMKPFPVTVGAGEVIPGWEQGLLSMRPGGKRRLTIPASLGYGASGSPPEIPPNADLVFDIELVSAR